MNVEFLNVLNKEHFCFLFLNNALFHELYLSSARGFSECCERCEISLPKAVHIVICPHSWDPKPFESAYNSTGTGHVSKCEGQRGVTVEAISLGMCMARKNSFSSCCKWLPGGRDVHSAGPVLDDERWWSWWQVLLVAAPDSWKQQRNRRDNPFRRDLFLMRRIMCSLSWVWYFCYSVQRQTA